MEEKERMGFIDGMKAVATILVFNIHFFNAYYCGVYTLEPADFRTVNGVEWWIGATPLNFIYAGKVGARMFLVLSAFLLALQYWKKADRRKLTLTPLKKYVRLVVPIMAANIFICTAMYLGAYRNAQAARLAGSSEFFGVYNQFTPSFPDAMWEAVFGCFFHGSNRYNGPLWFIQYEFLGCVLVAVILLMAGKWKRVARMLLNAVLALVLIRTDYLCMVLGAAVAELYVMLQKKEAFQIVEKCVQCRPLMWILFAISFLLCTYPSFGRTEGTIYNLLPPKVLFYYNVAIPALLFAVLYLRPVQKLLDIGCLKKFTGISYCFYLVHFPMLCTVSSIFFIAAYQKVNYHVLVCLIYVLTFALTLLAAHGMTKWIDKPMQRAAERIR